METYSYARSSTINMQPGAQIPYRHSRNNSSTNYPHDSYSSQDPSSPIRAYHQHNGSHQQSQHSRQSSTNTYNPQRHVTTTSIASAPRRSTSSRSTSTNSPTSYVALMRKQKETVWCDRAQYIDPRLAQAQRVAKQRAALEVLGGSTTSGRTNTITSTGMVGKIRHGGVSKAPGYSPANLSGAIVPLRLSANETLGDEENDAHSFGENGMVHGRSGSGKSSTSSAKYRSGYPRQDQGRYSGISTPPSGEGSPRKEGIPELSEAGQDKIETPKRDSEDFFGAVGDMKAPSALKQAVSEAQKADDLRRRGSVDERAMSMGAGVRLYVANPDVDSD